MQKRNGNSTTTVPVPDQRKSERVHWPPLFGNPVYRDQNSSNALLTVCLLISRRSDVSKAKPMLTSQLNPQGHAYESRPGYARGLRPSAGTLLFLLGDISA